MPEITTYRFALTASDVYKRQGRGNRRNEEGSDEYVEENDSSGISAVSYTHLVKTKEHASQILNQ